jgi:hypothetical protein
MNHHNFYARFLRILVRKTLKAFRLNLEDIVDLQPLAESLTAVLRQNRTLARLALTVVSKGVAKSLSRCSFEGLRSNNSLRERHIGLADDESWSLSESLHQSLLGARRKSSHILRTLAGVSFTSDSAAAAEIKVIVNQNRLG